MNIKPLVTVTVDPHDRDRRLAELLGEKPKRGTSHMFTPRPSIHIARIDKIEISNEWYTPTATDDALQPAPLRIPLDGAATPPASQSRWMRLLELASTVASVASGIAVVAFITLLLLGLTTVASVPIAKLLTVFSFALVGSVVSVGGIKIFSINASLRRALASESRCPFLALYQPIRDRDRAPGNPSVCVKCPLGIDTATGQPGGLIHNCRVYLTLHSQWLASRNALSQPSR